VAGGGKFVGEKRLVRIEEPGRTAAKAVLLDDSPRENGDGGDDALESKPRRRGRRGGRRRSAAKAESTASE
jgi:ribonuclease G